MKSSLHAAWSWQIERNAEIDRLWSQAAGAGGVVKKWAWKILGSICTLEVLEIYDQEDDDATAVAVGG